jgi:hypothetical protein
MTRQGGPKTLPAACRQDKQVWRLLQLECRSGGPGVFFRLKPEATFPTPFYRATPVPAFWRYLLAISRVVGTLASRPWVASHIANDRM